MAEMRWDLVRSTRALFDADRCRRHAPQANTADTRRHMFLRPAPSVESRAVQVWISLFGKQAIHRLKGVRRGIELPSQRSFHANVPLEHRGETGRKCRTNHRFAPLPVDNLPGTGSETSR